MSTPKMEDRINNSVFSLSNKQLEKVSAYKYVRVKLAEDDK